MAALLPQVDAGRFERLFDVTPTPETVAQLIDSKTLTIAKLHALVPPEAAVANPAPYLYDTTMQAMAGLVVVAGLVHYSIGPVDASRFAQQVGIGEGDETDEPLMVIDAEGAEKQTK